MSLSSTQRLPFVWPNVDVFTFGKSSIYGYDSINPSLIVHSLVDLNNLNNISNDRLHLSSSPTWPIRRLVLNEDETILALLADKIAYLVYLPQSNLDISKASPSKGSRLCQIIRIPPSISSSISINCSLIDFIWLTSNHFAIVYSIPSSSECHLYSIRSLKPDGIERIQTLSVGLSSTNKFGTPNKKISLHQPSDIIKLDVTKRKQDDFILILLFVMKTDGDIFVLEIDQNDLLLENKISKEFHGPLRILPSTFDNYGADHGQSTFISLSNSTYPIIIYTRDKSQLNQCILLSPSINDYSLFTIDSINFPINQNGQILTTILPDLYSSNKYFICDTLANVYLIEISWINQIQQGIKKLQSTHIQHLIQGENSKNKIEHIGFIQTNNHQQPYLAIIMKSQTTKELILIRLQSSKSIENSSSKKSDFVNHIHSLLSRDQSIPYVTVSTSTTNMSDTDLEKNLLQFNQIFIEQYIRKQENVRKELENKQDYIIKLQQTQQNEYKQLNERFQHIQKQLEILTKLYKQECSRRNRLSTHVNDLLSVIEQNIPVQSEAEIRMEKQLENYQTQIHFLEKQITRLQEFLSSNINQEQFDNSSMVNIHNLVQNHRNQIDQMKKQLETIQNNK